MVDFAGAIKKPFSDGKTALIGIVVGLIPVVSLLLSGYGVKVAQNSLNKNKSLPAWGLTNIGDQIIKSIMVLVIHIIYGIPGGILLAVALGAAIVTLLSSGDFISAFAAGGLIGILGILLLLVGAILASMGVIFYAKEGNFGAAFKFGAILKKVLTGKYIISLVVVIAWAIVLGIVAVILAIIPIIGSLVGAGLLGYALTVTAYTIFSEVFNETK